MTSPLDTVVKPSIILFGDSLTAWSFNTTHGQGFGDVLERLFEPVGIEVENEGYPGFTSESVKPLFAAIVKRIQTKYETPPLLVTVFLGANDAVLMPNVHVPIDQFAANIRGFIDAILVEPNAHSTKILLITTPPVNVRALRRSIDGLMSDAAFDEECRESIGHRTWASKLKYAQMIAEIGASSAIEGSDAEQKVAVIDFWSDITNFALEAEGRDTLPDGCQSVNTVTNERLPGSGLANSKEFPDGCFGDRLHLDADGYKVLTSSVLGKIKNVWPGLMRCTQDRMDAIVQSYPVADDVWREI